MRINAAELAQLPALQDAALRYAEALAAFLQAHGLEELPMGPVDHAAVKAADAADFERALALLQEAAAHTSYTHLGGRRLAAIQLSQPLDFGAWGETDYLELMEPRPDRTTPGLTGFDHIELRVGPLNPVRAVLERKRVPFRFQEHDSHSSVVLRINEVGQEVKFTDVGLRGIVAEQIRTGESIVIKG
jgi:predicted metalloenzyme YecM